MSTGIRVGTRLPNLVVIGVTKAGTSSLFEYLGRHPDIGLADVKEVRYFSPLRHGGVLEPPAAYAEHFVGLDERYALEATPGYFYGGGVLARAIAETCPDARVILSLREPVDRCWSWYRFAHNRTRIPQSMSFRAYLERCRVLHEEDRDGLVENQPYWGLGGGCYDRWLDEWIDVFGPAMNVVFFDDLVSDAAGMVSELLCWLDLDPELADLQQLEAKNVTMPHRHQGIQRVAVWMNKRTRPWSGFIRRHPRAKSVLRSGYYRLNRARAETMRPADRDWLNRFYAPHTARLAAQLDQLELTLPQGWSR